MSDFLDAVTGHSVTEVTDLDLTVTLLPVTLNGLPAQ